MKNRILDYLVSTAPPPPEGAARRKPSFSDFDARRLAARAEQWIAEHPGAALGAALTVGVLIGWLIKRK